MTPVPWHCPGKREESWREMTWGGSTSVPALTTELCLLQGVVGSRGHDSSLSKRKNRGGQKETLPISLFLAHSIYMHTAGRHTQTPPKQRQAKCSPAWRGCSEWWSSRRQRPGWRWRGWWLSASFCSWSPRGTPGCCQRVRCRWSQSRLESAAPSLSGSGTHPRIGSHCQSPLSPPGPSHCGRKIC